jgi:hypothetical protein
VEYALIRIAMMGYQPESDARERGQIKKRLVPWTTALSVDRSTSGNDVFIIACARPEVKARRKTDSEHNATDCDRKELISR